MKRKIAIIVVGAALALMNACESPTEPGTVGLVELYRDPGFTPPTSLIGISGDFDRNLLIRANEVEIVNDTIIGDGEGYYYAFFIKFTFYDEPGFLTGLHVYENGAIDHVYFCGFGGLRGLIEEAYITLRSDDDRGDGIILFSGDEWDSAGYIMDLDWVYDPADDAYGRVTFYDDGTYDAWFENLGETPDGHTFALWHRGTGTVAAEAETILIGKGTTNEKGELLLSGGLPRAFRGDDELYLTLETEPDAIDGPSLYRILFGKAGG
ncbi:MAG: hypothetical protein JSW52_09885 [Candidatus Coatesbacteria bacterium]|nr:MAG: hypothetical protein JSW52_09885 [Candidatus Coatesbacteria bacterium]